MRTNSFPGDSPGVRFANDDEEDDLYDDEEVQEHFMRKKNLLNLIEAVAIGRNVNSTVSRFLREAEEDMEQLDNSGESYTSDTSGDVGEVLDLEDPNADEEEDLTNTETPDGEGDPYTTGRFFDDETEDSMTALANGADDSETAFMEWINESDEDFIDTDDPEYGQEMDDLEEDEFIDNELDGYTEDEPESDLEDETFSESVKRRARKSLRSLLKEEEEFDFDELEDDDEEVSEEEGVDYSDEPGVDDEVVVTEEEDCDDDDEENPFPKGKEAVTESLNPLVPEFGLGVLVEFVGSGNENLPRGSVGRVVSQSPHVGGYSYLVAFSNGFSSQIPHADLKGIPGSTTLFT